MNDTRPAPLQDRVALVTGANHGIGLATAAALAERGADVVAAYLRTGDPHKADAFNRARSTDGSAVSAAVKATGGRCHTIESDLADPATPAMLMNEAERVFGPVSVLVHNASGWQKDSFSPDRTDAVGLQGQLVSEATINSQLHVDARAGALLMAEFITRHRARGASWGRIVTLTSGEGRQFPGEVSYGAGKAALISYTLSAAAEMAEAGVTANVVYPPVTDTGWITEEVREFVSRDLEHHHIATPEEVAEVIAWLCADAGRTVTGNIIRLR